MGFVRFSSKTNTLQLKSKFKLAHNSAVTMKCIVTNLSKLEEERM